MAINAFEGSRITEGTLPQGSTPVAETSVREPDFQTGSDRQYRRVQSAGSMIGDRVHNGHGESLGTIEQIMVEVATGRVAYAVLSFGGFLGIGDKLFAVPWEALRLDEARQEFVLDVDKSTLENAPGFEKSNWPDMADPAFGSAIAAHYGQGSVLPDSGGTGRSRVFEQAVTDAGDYVGDNEQPNRSMEFEPAHGFRETKTTE